MLTQLLPRLSSVRFGALVFVLLTLWPSQGFAQPPIRVYVNEIPKGELIDVDTTRRTSARAQLIAALKRDKVPIADRMDDADVLIEILPNDEPPPEKKTEIGWKPFIGFYPKAQKNAPINVAMIVGDYRSEIRGHVDTDVARHASRKIKGWLKDNEARLRERHQRQ